MSKETCAGYHHVTPGRMRVRVTGIKGERQAARSLEVLLTSQPGITHVRANPLTGNVLVRFDEEAMTSGDVLQSLADLGHLPLLSETSDRQAEQDATDSKLSEIGISLGKTLAKAALKQALGASPAAIILELL